ncbi:MAG: hypothetical protein OEW12_04645 [Deltaproteobacteria bacterium]|nr:hypothetical protein [Deltaproteobacteria bacterium]
MNPMNAGMAPPLKMNGIKGAVLWGAALLCVTLNPMAAFGYEPAPADIFSQLASHAHFIKRAVITLHHQVYGPYSPEDFRPGQMETTPPRETPAQSFLQTVYYSQNDFLAIKTFSPDGKPLHFYYKDARRTLAGNLTSGRTFSMLDVLHPAFPFMEENPEKTLHGLSAWGIYPTGISLYRSPKGNLFYRMGTEGESELWVENETLYPVKMNQWMMGKVPPVELSIEFTDNFTTGAFNKASKNMIFPRTVNFLLNGRLIKQILTVQFTRNPPAKEFPADALKAQADQLESQNPEFKISQAQTLSKTY